MISTKHAVARTILVGSVELVRKGVAAKPSVNPPTKLVECTGRSTEDRFHSQ